ncbi:hypothetical protein [Roseibium litorale]|uniref:Uncharacterized protein n=1 Tax=Roseibium litorale TaxID=2803841 RepID=A0ABR9CJL7_9HYPH|nr:hypothetical protein [Roseibium litorale]MBD8890928.1 hypothetical protein [Roseibium litorale]
MSASLIALAVVSAVACGGTALVVTALADAKRKADREFGDWPDQVEQRKR